ncbi:unnamed protein product, partial [Hapterophycus canaliculatus]
RRNKSEGRPASATPSSASSRKGPLQRAASFGSDSSFKNMARNTFQPSLESLRAARSAITRSSPRHQRFQVAPRSANKRKGTFGPDSEALRRRRERRSGGGGRGSGSGSGGGGTDGEKEAASADPPRRSDDVEQGMTSRDLTEARSSADAEADAILAGAAANSECGSAYGSSGDGPSPPGSARGKSSSGPIEVPTVRASAKVVRPTTLLKDALAGKVKSGKMRRGSSGRLQGAVPMLDLRRSSSTPKSAAERGDSAGDGTGGAAAGWAAAAAEAEAEAAAAATAAAMADTPDRRREVRQPPQSGSRRRSGGGVLTEAYGDARRYRSSATFRSSNSNPSRRAASDGGVGRGRPRGQLYRSGSSRSTSSSSCSSGSSSSSGSSGGGGDWNGGAGGSRSFSDGEEDGGSAKGGGGGGGGGSGASRGRSEFRQSTRSRMRELAYQAARSRSRGSCRSLISLQRVDEVSEEGLSSVSPDKQMAAAGGGESGGGGRGGGDGDDPGSTAGGGVVVDANGAKSTALFHPLSAAGGDKHDGNNALSAVAMGKIDGGARATPKAFPPCSSVSPSSAPRYPVSEIKVPGNAA